MNLSAETVGTLVQQAFCLEALADKQDCTSRYTDLPNKPLEDFIIAGTNAGPFFAKFAAERLAGSKLVYGHFKPALKSSNLNKSDKYINMGLLEVMFNAVAARLVDDNHTTVVQSINKQLARGSKADARVLIEAREIGWSTSKNKDKLKLFDIPELHTAKNAYEFNELLYKHTDKESASYQWAVQAHTDWPLLQRIFNGLERSKAPQLLDKIAEVFNPIRSSCPDIRIGILADMCAAAIFLHLSFRSR